MGGQTCWENGVFGVFGKLASYLEDSNQQSGRKWNRIAKLKGKRYSTHGGFIHHGRSEFMFVATVTACVPALQFSSILGAANPIE